MSQVWFHIGMPKAASTTIQYLLARGLPDYQQRDWTREHLRESIRGSEQLMRLLRSDWSDSPMSTGYAALALRSRATYLMSSEDYTGVTPELLDRGSFVGLAIVRPPADWIPSSATQNLMFELPHDVGSNGAADSVWMSLERALDQIQHSEEQLSFLIENRALRYLKLVTAVRKWYERSAGLDVVAYTSGLDIREVLRSSLRRVGAALEYKGETPTLRTSFPFVLTQLGTQIHQTARTDFGMSVAQARSLRQLALGIEPEILRTHLIGITPSTHEHIAETLRSAHSAYEALLADCNPTAVPTPFSPPEFEIVEYQFAQALARSMIRTSIRAARVPDDFDSAAYLQMNHDLAEHAETLGDQESRDSFARDHFARHGAFEIRPAPRRSSGRNLSR